MGNSIKKELWWKPAVTTDVVIVTIEDGALKVLLIKRAGAPFKDSYALPGGFLRKGESSESAARRVLKEKAGAADFYMEQLYTFDDPRRDPRGQVMSVAYFALVSREKVAFKKTLTAQHPQLFSVGDLPELAFDHHKIILYAVRRLRAKLEYTNIVFSLLPRLFTFSQLQRTYEIILGKKIDKRNFQKKFMTLGLIVPTKKLMTGLRQRPARLYRFLAQKPAELKKFF